MWFAKRKKRPFIEVTKLSSLIAEDVQIVGDVSFATGIRVTRLPVPRLDDDPVVGAGRTPTR